ncbi:head GIN domain-containing protein [Maritalea sp.]|uniref:head GIN domain-containing protein n=1 Tax=Maritalea sp. TaxID=2003361 RepID=UPI003EF297AF
MKNQTIAATISVPLLIAGMVVANAEERKLYEFSGFSFVEVHEGIDVNIVQGDTFSVESIANKQSHLDKLKITHRSDRLIIEQKTDWSILGLLSIVDNWNKELQVNVVMPKLVEAESNSGSDLHIEGFNEKRLTLSAKSGSDLVAKGLTVDQLYLEGASGANLTAEGTCTELNAEASSGADVLAKAVTCETGQVEVSSGADMSVTISGHVKADAVAGGTVTVQGNPKTQDIEEQAGGDVIIVR